jgi:hypothetical protein
VIMPPSVSGASEVKKIFSASSSTAGAIVPTAKAEDKH